MRHKNVSQLTPGIMLFFIALPGVLGQHLSVGFVGGTNLTRDFHTFGTDYLDPAFPGGLTTFLLYSDSRSFIAGPTVEIPLPKRFSIEVDALHRSLQLKRAFILPGGQRVNDGGNGVGTWEFPLLLKYKLPLSKVRPFVEVGPSFRVRKNPGSANPRLYGVTAGLGAEFGVGRFRIAPAIRYTRWAPDPPYPTTSTNADQVEFLTEISYASTLRAWNTFGGELHAGLVAAIPFTNGLEANPPFGAMVSESQGYAVGMMTEFEVAHRFSAEVEALYRPLRAHLVSESNGATERIPFSVVTWEFPVLAKYRLRTAPKLQPFIEAGPSFRLSGNLNGYSPSHYGFAAGVGIETHAQLLRIAPVIRYTRWADDNPFNLSVVREHTRTNQVELLVGFSF